MKPKGEIVGVSASRVEFDLGIDNKGRRHTIMVSLETGVDGTTGIRIQGIEAGLRMEPLTQRLLYITTQRPDRVRKDTL